MTKESTLDLLAYGFGGLLVGLLRRDLLSAAGSALSGDLLIHFFGLPMLISAAAAAYGLGWFFFHKGPERGLLRLGVFGAAMACGMFFALGRS